jgi:SRSO17 transposase
VNRAAKDATPAGLLREDDVTGEDLEAAIARIRGYAVPYQELLVRSEQAEHLLQMVEGLTSDLERKSVEPIAVMHGIHRRGLQRFVGEPGWDYRPLRALQLREVSDEIGVADGAVVVDGTATPKKGEETVGVARQWCGRLGKVDNCVVGVHATYVGRAELATLVSSELFLPEEWTKNRVRREAAYVPSKVVYQSRAQIAANIVEDLASTLPFEWVMGDDEFGRSQDFRDRVAKLGKSYVLDVPENTQVRRVNKWGRVLAKNWKVSKLVRSRPVAAWASFHVRDGEKGPIRKRALMLPVATWRDGEREEPGHWVRETLLVLEELDGSEVWYCLCHAKPGMELPELVRRASQRHRVEEVFQEAKGELGLDHFEVRSWHGWHHHMTLVQISHWFLVRERRRLGGKITRHHHQPDPNGDCPTPCSSTDSCSTRGPAQLPSAPQQGRTRRPLCRQGLASTYPPAPGVIEQAAQ